MNIYFHISGGLTALRLFMKSEHCEENIEFWMACEEFRKIRSRSKLKSRAKTIYDEFIRVDSPKEVRFSQCQQSWFVSIKPCHTFSFLSLPPYRSTWTSTQRRPSTKAFWSQHSRVSKLPKTEFTSWWSTTRTLGSWTLNSITSSAESLQGSDNVFSRKLFKRMAGPFQNAAHLVFHVAIVLWFQCISFCIDL